MTGLLDHLEGFNSKERFYLITQVLGRTDLLPSAGVLNQICAELGIDAVPKRVFAAMDYHLDWLYASLRLAADDAGEQIHLNDERIVRAQQEDIDYLLALEMEAIVHIILVEAKGVTPWKNDQLLSKAIRFGQIFGSVGAGVHPHFILISPREPKGISVNEWPEWMAPRQKLHWIPLRVPERLCKVTRCDVTGKASESGTHWRVSARGRTKWEKTKGDVADLAENSYVPFGPLPFGPLLA